MVLSSVGHSGLSVPFVVTVEPFKSMFSSLPSSSTFVHVVVGFPSNLSHMFMTVFEVEVILSQIVLGSSVAEFLP